MTESVVLFQKDVKSIRLRPVSARELHETLFQKDVKSIRLRPMTTLIVGEG